MYEDLIRFLGTIKVVGDKAARRRFRDHPFQEFQAATYEICADMQDALSRWPGKGICEQGMAELLEETIARYQSQSGLAVILTVAPTWKEEVFLPNARRKLLRVLQEALINVHTHAAAREVHINLSIETGHAKIWIEDDGSGFCLSPHLYRLLYPTFPRHGICRMRDWTRSIGGFFRIRSIRGRGTCIVLDIPLNRSTSALWR